ncbi:MAG: DUF3035 domain-containing protein, partial [Betaproteobacteria bacterium]|nr:DUF3035 domain-containing protein [Betaproteobacteria bacterium]
MKKTFGLEANPPDAYQVGTLPPLSLPPELGQLQQPNPGQPPTQEQSAADQGADVIAPANALPSGSQPVSAAGQAFLDQAGPAPQGDIRAEVNQNAAVASRSGGFVDKLMGTNPNAPAVVNAGEEQRRLQENAAMGQPATNGATPQESSASPGLFQRFLNLF